MNKRIITWEEFDQLINQLAEKIKQQLSPNIKYISGFPRGGVIPTAVLSHKLGLKYVNMDVDLLLINNGSIIVIDDICDSGKTLFNCPFMNFTLFYKENDLHTPTSYVEKIDKDVWIVFPWENKESETIQDYKLEIPK
jgi:hypoxanthine phosphoribosyltransferase